MTDWVVFSWYVANLGAAAGGVCLRAHSPRKLSKWRLPCNEVGCWLLSVAERMVAAAALSSRSMQTSFFYAPRHFLAHFWTLPLLLLLLLPSKPLINMHQSVAKQAAPTAINSPSSVTIISQASLHSIAQILPEEKTASSKSLFAPWHLHSPALSAIREDKCYASIPMLDCSSS